MIECDIELKLPKSIDDLLPPETTLRSRPVKVSSSRWNTMFIYHLSEKLLRYLIKRNAILKLKIFSNSKDISPSHIYDLPLSEARYFEGADKSTDIRKCISHDSRHLAVTGRSNLELQCGLFVSPMTKRYDEKQCSINSSEYVYHDFADSRRSEKALDILSQPYPSATSSTVSITSDATACFSDSSRSSVATSIMPFYQQIGRGHEQYTFFLNIKSANFVQALLSAQDIALKFQGEFRTKAFLRYQLFGEVYNIPLDHNKPFDITRSYFSFRGNKKDILDWISLQPKLRLSVITYKQNNQELEIGYSLIPLQNQFVTQMPQGKLFSRDSLPYRSYPIYDRKNKLVLQSKMTIANLNVQSGLCPYWFDNEVQDTFANTAVKKENKDIYSNPTKHNLYVPNHTKRYPATKATNTAKQIKFVTISN